MSSWSIRHAVAQTATGSPEETRQSGVSFRRDVTRWRRLVALLEEAEALLAGAATIRSAFPALVEIVSRALSLRAIAIVPRDLHGASIVWTESPRDRALAESEATAFASLAQLDTLAGSEAFLPLAGAPRGDLGWVALPLALDDGTIVGVLAIAQEPHEGNDDAELAFVTSLARYAAPLVVRDRGGSPACAATELVSDATAVLLDGLDYRENLATLVRMLGSRLDATCAAVVRSSVSFDTVHASGRDEQVILETIDPLVERVLARGTTMLAEHPLSVFAAEELGAAWVVVVPLRSRAGALGALAIAGTSSRPLPLSSEQLEELGRLTGAAIVNGLAHESVVDAARKREEMLWTVSHDLKNPIGVILMSVARLVEEGEGAPRLAGRTPAEMIQRSAQRMRRLVCDLLDTAALEGGAMRMKPARREARALVEEALDAVAPIAAEASVRLEQALPTSLPTLWVDADRIQQVLANIVGNAVKFTPAGGIVRISAKVAGDELAISVADTGVGIAPNELPHVFDRFWRAERTRNLGSGLGLAIAKSIIELTGGTIEVKSELDVGTTVTFTLPLASRLALV